MSINSVIISGRLTADPKITSTSTGLLVGNFSVAVSEYYKQQERTSFFECVAFGKVAERLEKICMKGTLVGVEGSLKQETYEAKDGNKRSKVSIITSRIEVFDKFKNASGGGETPSRASSEMSQPQQNNSMSEEDYFSLDNEIPF